MLGCFWQHVGLIFSIILHMGGYTKKTSKSNVFQWFLGGSGGPRWGQVDVFSRHVGYKVVKDTTIVPSSRQFGGIVGVLDGVKIVCPYANVDLQLLRAFKMPCDSPQALRIMMSWRVQSQVPSRFGLTWVPKSFETSQVRAQMAPSPLTWRQDGPKLFELEPRWPLVRGSKMGAS